MLIFSQTLFYLTVSFAIIALSILFGLIAYNLMRITKDLSKISNNFSEASDDLREKLEEVLEEVLEQLYEIPVLSSFLRKRAPTKHSKKGRE